MEGTTTAVDNPDLPNCVRYVRNAGVYVAVDNSFRCGECEDGFVLNL